MSLYNKKPAEGSSEVLAVCPWCHKKITYEFKHNHTYTTESKLVSIKKGKDENSN